MNRFFGLLFAILLLVSGIFLIAMGVHEQNSLYGFFGGFLIGTFVMGTN